MRNLLSAGFVRLWRSRALWLSCAVAAGYVLPGGQTGQYVTAEVSRPWLLILYDAALIAAATGVGLVLFRRKDLK